MLRAVYISVRSQASERRIRDTFGKYFFTRNTLRDKHIIKIHRLIFAARYTERFYALHEKYSRTMSFAVEFLPSDSFFQNSAVPRFFFFPSSTDIPSVDVRYSRNAHCAPCVKQSGNNNRRVDGKWRSSVAKRDARRDASKTGEQRGRVREAGQRRE